MTHDEEVRVGRTVRGRVLGDLDVHLLAEGTHLRSYDCLGAHPRRADAGAETAFAVWAPNARAVSVIGDFNDWEPDAHPLALRSEVGVWEGTIPGIGAGTLYKYRVVGADGSVVDKADPYAFRAELRPATASIVCDLDGFEWGDAGWLDRRLETQADDAPLAIYEVHLGSWARVPEEGERWLTYEEIAPRLAEYAREMGYTHVELLPIAEHALDESWGYQTTAYFAPTSRFGTPQQFMAFVDTLHRAGLGVILDWVPGHFPRDAHGLLHFDGTALYEYADSRLGAHFEWGTAVFNYGRREVANFLLANALFWVERYHLDGLRVDAVASMLYRDYSRTDWVPNAQGGREHLEATAFLRQLNATMCARHPGVLMIAEESTSWPQVSHPVEAGGLGFTHKWNMGWMHDTLQFFQRDPMYRGFHLNELTFSLLYAYTERFVLPYSHDEVVHGKGSMLGKMPGDDWQQFANLRAVYGYLYGHPGKKLLFMGSDFGQRAEWNAMRSLDWHLLDAPGHRGVQTWVRDLNRMHREARALHERDADSAGFEWIDGSDTQNVVLAFVRQAPADGGRLEAASVLVVCNLTPVPRHEYALGVPREGTWHLRLNSDDRRYGGSGHPVARRYASRPESRHGQPQSLSLTLPPLSTLFLSPEAPHGDSTVEGAS